MRTVTSSCISVVALQLGGDRHDRHNIDFRVHAACVACARSGKLPVPVSDMCAHLGRARSLRRARTSSDPAHDCPPATVRVWRGQCGRLGQRGQRGHGLLAPSAGAACLWPFFDLPEHGRVSVALPVARNGRGDFCQALCAPPFRFIMTAAISPAR